ncbi:hypothetical protein E2542_SST12472 [Spatholobus suberectus]|nr:hypothetical protein E2542_SST12472 [Spatholobus suberectus]
MLSGFARTMLVLSAHTTLALPCDPRSLVPFTLSFGSENALPILAFLHGCVPNVPFPLFVWLFAKDFTFPLPV